MNWTYLRYAFPPFNQLVLLYNPSAWTVLARLHNPTSGGLVFAFEDNNAFQLEAQALDSTGKVQPFYWCVVDYPEFDEDRS